ncbi:MAG: hypothetical protein JNL61_12575 [Rhizobiaceae bacterium]|nr:hypothetical protein [Rhizobiaceae bacterium]
MTETSAKPFDLASVPIGLTRDSEEFRTSTHRFAQFAKSVDDSNPKHLAGAIGSPVFAHIPVMQSMVEVLQRATGEFILHGEHDFVFHAPMLPGQRWFSQSKLVGAKATRAGVVFIIRSDTRTHDGKPVSTQYSSCLARGLSASGAVGEALPARPATPAGDAVSSRYPLAADQTRRYADAARDYSPYTLDPAAAAKVGFPAPLVHGMLTMALAGRAVVDGPAGGDMARLKRLGGRFANPLLLTPGQAVTVSLRSSPGGIVGFEAADAAGSTVISNGYAEVVA